jgi:hypothetical protein
MLFHVISGRDFFEENPGARAVPEFEACTSREMSYVALMTDYDTPLIT